MNFQSRGTAALKRLKYLGLMSLSFLRILHMHTDGKGKMAGELGLREFQQKEDTRVPHRQPAMIVRNPQLLERASQVQKESP